MDGYKKEINSIEELRKKFTKDTIKNIGKRYFDTDSDKIVKLLNDFPQVYSRVLEMSIIDENEGNST